ncbi:hypothetical protein [Lysobacter claricitrinus]|uniref:hypothetical protein n=1 Tax=Lysobacter claricitrinus TaxID=3367728 RepID=UPI0037DB97BF
MRHEVDRDRVLALALTALVQAAFVLMLVRFVPASRVAAAVDDALVVSYVPRRRTDQETSTVRAPEVQPRVASLSAQRRHRSGNRSSSSVSGTSVDDDFDAAPAPLDLRIPEPPTFPDHFATREHRTDPSINVRTTRFADAWRGGGTLLDEARARSGIVRIATSLFGGPPRHCSEVERRLRKPDCLPEPADLELDP